METNKNSQNPAEVAVVEKNENGVIVVDLNGQLPDLSKAEAMPFDLSTEYWSPETPGEPQEKRLFFDRIDERPVKDQMSGSIINLECAIFIEITDDGARSVSNGSKTLVGAMVSNRIQRGTPLLIKFMGRKQNKSNQKSSASWSIKPLRLSI